MITNIRYFNIYLLYLCFSGEVTIKNKNLNFLDRFFDKFILTKKKKKKDHSFTTFYECLISLDIVHNLLYMTYSFNVIKVFCYKHVIIFFIS